MDIKIDEIRQKFLGELDRELFPLGFKYVKSKHGYILKQENWYFHFLIDCVKWSTSVHITTKVIAENLLINGDFYKLLLLLFDLVKGKKSPITPLKNHFNTMQSKYKIIILSKNFFINFMPVYSIIV